MTEMAQTQIKSKSKLITFNEFLDWKPEDKRYELYKGIVKEKMQPRGKHEEIVGFLLVEFAFLSRQRKLSYSLPKQALVKLPNEDTTYLPDVLLVNSKALKDEPLWQKSSTITKGSSIPLVVEVVSSNWRNDYLTKLRDYEEIGINEYWIVDYLGTGGYRYIGNPKQPTISVYQLIEDEYQLRQFRDNQIVISPTFLELDLTANQVFQGER